MMCIICCPLPKNWKPSWIVLVAWIGCSSHASVPSSRRPWRGSAIRMNSGVFADLEYSVERTAAVLRALWQWREKEAEKADRPPFHILQNEDLLKAAAKFASGSVPDYRHFSFSRRQAFREAAQAALRAPESEWPVSRRRFGTRPSTETVQRAEELRRRRNKSAEELGLEPSFIAPRSTLEAIATDGTRAAALLVPWQRELLGVSVFGNEKPTNPSPGSTLKT